MYSLFEKAVSAEEETMVRFLHHQEIGFAEADSFVPHHYDFSSGQERYLGNLRALKERLEIPVITSLNGTTPGGRIAILHARTGLSLGATGGIHTPEDAIKLLLAGTHVVHLCGLLLEQGPQALGRILKGIETWMDEQGFESVGDFRGRLSQRSVADPSAFERVNYVHILDSFSLSSGAWG